VRIEVIAHYLKQTIVLHETLEAELLSRQAAHNPGECADWIHNQGCYECSLQEDLGSVVHGLAEAVVSAEIRLGVFTREERG
jgi:hypothetical protein